MLTARLLALSLLGLILLHPSLLTAAGDGLAATLSRFEPSNEPSNERCQFKLFGG